MPSGTDIPGAVILGNGCFVHPTAVVGHMPFSSPALARQPDFIGPLRIGDGTIVSPHAVLYVGTTIGADCLIGDGASIREGCKIGDRCVIGRHVTIHYDAVIGDDVRILDGAHITGGCVIGDGSFIGPGVVTCNDRNIDLLDYAYRGCTPPTFGRRVMVGAGAKILAGVTIGDDALIGIGAVVVDDVPAGARALGPKATIR